MFQHMQKKLVAGGTASWVVIKPRVLGHESVTAQHDRLFPSVTLPPTVSLDIFPDTFVI